MCLKCNWNFHFLIWNFKIFEYKLDIPCLSECCPLTQKCHEKVSNISFTSLLQDDCMYLIPDIKTIELYLELFEHENLNNIIIAQTVFENVINYLMKFWLWIKLITKRNINLNDQLN